MLNEVSHAFDHEILLLIIDLLKIACVSVQNPLFIMPVMYLLRMLKVLFSHFDLSLAGETVPETFTWNCTGNVTNGVDVNPLKIC